MNELSKERLDGIQRRRHRHHHHDHGAGTAGAAWRRLAGACEAAADIPELRSELPLHRDLLEQSSSPAACIQACERQDLVGKPHLFFWLSLIPFATGWMGENHFDRAADRPLWRRPVHAGNRLSHPAIDDHPSEGRTSGLARALGRDFKGKISPILYGAAIGLAFIEPWISCGIYTFVALMWLVPDKRIEKMLSN